MPVAGAHAWWPKAGRGQIRAGAGMVVGSAGVAGRPGPGRCPTGAQGRGPDPIRAGGRWRRRPWPVPGAAALGLVEQLAL